LQNRAAWVIATFLMLGLAAALFAVWHLRAQSRQALEFFGSRRARLFVQAPAAELMRLAPAESTNGAATNSLAETQIEMAGRAYEILDRRDAVATRGFLHVRRGLMTDASYQWPAMPLASATRWDYAVRFMDGGEEVLLVVAFDPPLVSAQGLEQAASIAPVAQGIEAFFRQAFQTSDP
jgi:hypothetical protein